MPVFEGQNPEGWVFRVERYFLMNNLQDLEKLDAAAISLDGEALAWFQWENGRRPMHTWKEFKHRLLNKFMWTQEWTLCEKILALK